MKLKDYLIVIGLFILAALFNAQMDVINSIFVLINASLILAQEYDWQNNHIRIGEHIMSSKYHNLSTHPLNQVWKDMKQRCYNPSHSQFGYWGGRGISVCNEWKNDFVVFYNWAIQYWKPRLQIDRIDNNGNYKPSNCRFVTNQVNGQNTRHCKLTATDVLDIKNLKLLCGKSLQNKEIAEAYSIDRSAISRILAGKRWANI